MKKLFIVILTFFYILIANEKITAVVPSNFPPYYILDKKNNLDGFAVELLNNIAIEVDLEVDYIIKDDFKSAVSVFLSKKADLIPSSGITEERKKDSIFSNSTDTFKVVAFKRTSEKFTHKNSFKMKKVVLVKKNVAVKLLTKHPKELIIIKDNNKEALFSLLSGEADVFVYPELPIVQMLKNLDLEDKLEIYGNPLAEVKRAIRVQKDKQELLSKLNEGLEKLKKSGKYQSIYTKWFSHEKTIEIEQKVFDRAVLFIIIIIILLFLLIMFLIRTNHLKKSVLHLNTRFHNMFNDHGSVMLLISPSSGRIIDANYSAVKFYGYSKSELLKLDLNSINISNYKTSFSNDKFEFTHKLKDGSLRIVDVHSTPIENENEKVLFSIIEDITDKKDFENQLTKAQRLGKIGSYTYNFKDDRWFSSPELDNILGIPKDYNKTFESWIFLVHPSFKEEVLEYFNTNVLDKKKPFDMTYKIMKYKTNEEVWVRSKGEVKLDTFGNLYEICGVKQDITNEKAMRDKLIKQKEELSFQKLEFETIFHYSKDGIAILDLDTKFLNFNDAYLSMTGFNKKELLSKTCFELTVLEDRERTKEALNEVFEVGFIKNFEKTCLLKDNKRIKVTISVSLLPDKKRFLMVTKDTTALKLMEEQSRLASMGEMIGNIAHQWRQPLSIITTYASGAKLQFDLEELSKKDMDMYMDSILKQSNYLSETIDNFREFIKGEKIYEKVSLNKVVKSALELSEASLKNNYIKTILDVNEEFFIEGIDNELIEALINILNNSKDALLTSENTESERFILISIRKVKNKKINLSIHDNAGGIDKKIIKKIFDPYFTTKHKSQGTGLGLSMVSKIIMDRHQAHIDVFNESFELNSKKYFGACFSIYFDEYN
jgi:PAS domain S-box-containing protein